jgi:hypothetical protein
VRKKMRLEDKKNKEREEKRRKKVTNRRIE